MHYPLRKFFIVIGMVGAMAQNHLFAADIADKDEEWTVSSMQRSLDLHQTTCAVVVKNYLDRIKIYDKAGTQPINAIIAINPNALHEAMRLDAGHDTIHSLYCVPMIIKDNIDVNGMATTAGSLSLKNSYPHRDATLVQRLRAAGAIVVAKSNLAEFAWTPDKSKSSLGGLTRNPYDHGRTTGGSSGGTAAAIAADFGLVGIGTDTGASIRGPSSFQSLVGLRPTLGAVSRYGILPITETHDTAGPMARTVVDAARVFQVIAGVDPKDPFTKEAEKLQLKKLNQLAAYSLRGKRIGVLRQTMSDADPDIVRLFDQALSDLKKSGAILVEVNIPNLEEMANIDWPNRLRYDINQYLATLGKDAPIKAFDQIVVSGEYDREVEPFLKRGQAAPHTPAQDLKK